MYQLRRLGSALQAAYFAREGRWQDGTRWAYTQHTQTVVYLFTRGAVSFVQFPNSQLQDAAEQLRMNLTRRLGFMLALASRRPSC